MSGHSKWATIKHKKGAQDKARGKLFAKLIRQVEVAAREGGNDVSSNAGLRTAFAKARDASVPLDTIERAVKRGVGELEGVRYEAISYEGYAPAGVAVIVECLSDNRNRTGAEIRNIFVKSGGSMSEPGAVSWQFERKGIVVVTQKRDDDGNSVPSEDQVMMAGLEAGAEDLLDNGDSWQLSCAASDVHSLKDALEEQGYEVTHAEATLMPTTVIELDNESDASKVLRVVDTLEDHDDVQNVYANFDIPDNILEQIED